jgi:penicillin-binding protein 2
LAARGQRFAPRLLIGTENARTREVQYTEPTALPSVTEQDPGHWQIVIDGMIGVTSDPRSSATAHFRGASYTIAGKTGTAQVVNIAQDERYREEDLDERLRDHGLFIAFAPVDAPRIALGVIVENGGGGARAAAPVARRILDAYFAAENYVAREP